MQARRTRARSDSLTRTRRRAKPAGAASVRHFVRLNPTQIPVPSASPLTVLSFGEALWDVLPRGIFLGGAPLNVAYHLSQHGIRALPVSAIGRDFLGDEIRRRAAGWDLDLRFVARLRGRPTGTVQAVLDAHGAATYRIERRVAWDRIPAPRSGRGLTAPAAIVYGSLALRERPNRLALARLFARWPDATRVLDINLRQPFDRGEPVAWAVRHARFVKLNDEELGRLTGARVGTVAALARAARAFAGCHHLPHVCVTAGARGAGLWWEGRWFWEPGRRVAVRDTVGSGDAFLAALLAALWKRREAPPVALAKACRLGEFVAMSDGATPSYQCDARGNPRPAGTQSAA
jgi:fructokinase